jgi:signal-transduction protein with cAMP-binding, CBS, and nucleotidyltransferase domain
MSEGFFVPVGDVMSRELEYVDRMATIGDALNVMSEKNISSLVVERRDERDEYGLIRVVDIADEIISRRRPISRTNVYEIMIKPAPALDAEMNIQYAVRFMTRFGLSHCLVLRGRQAVGLVTLRDMTIRYLQASEGTESAASRPEAPADAGRRV